MSVFAVTAIKNPDAILQSIKTHYGTGFYQFSDNVWFVSDSIAARAVADKLGITDGKINATGVVLKLSGYSGFAPTSAWTWLQQYPEAWTG